MATTSTEATHRLLLDRTSSCTISPVFYRNICLRLIQDLKRQPGKPLFPSQVHAPFPAAGPGLLCKDMHTIRDHLEKISTMPKDEVAIVNGVLTAQKASKVQQQMDVIQSLRPRDSHLVWSTSSGVHIHHLNSLIRIRSEYYAILPSTFRINDLPLDVLIEILHFAISPSIMTKSKLVAAIRLSHVCQKWRAVAISDGNLWNPIHFTWPATYEIGFLLLERAGLGDTRVDVCIGDSKSWMPIPIQVLKSLVAKIFKRTRRLRRLSVFAADTEAASLIFDTLTQASESLESLSLQIVPIPKLAPMKVTPASHILDRPLFENVVPDFFRHINLRGIGLDWTVNMHLLPDLTTLELHSIALHDAPTSSLFRTILRRTTSLSKLVLDSAGPAYPPDKLFTSPIPLLSLKTLVIGGCSGAYFQYLLSHFKSPNVLNLTVTHQLQHDLGDVLNALTYSNPMPRVRVLVLNKVYIKQSLDTVQAQMLTDWVMTMPHLTFLRLIDIKSRILHTIQPESPESTHDTLIAKELRYLDWQTTFQSYNFEDVQHFLASRKHLGRPLERLWIGAHMVSVLQERDVEICQASLQETGIVAISDEPTDEEVALTISKSL